MLLLFIYVTTITNIPYSKGYINNIYVSMFQAYFLEFLAKTLSRWACDVLKLKNMKVQTQLDVKNCNLRKNLNLRKISLVTNIFLKLEFVCTKLTTYLIS